MSAIRETPVIQEILDSMDNTQLSALLSIMDNNTPVPSEWDIGSTMASGYVAPTAGPNYYSIQMPSFRHLLNANTGDSEKVNKPMKVVGALYKATGSTSYSFIELGNEVCRIWYIIQSVAYLSAQTISVVELRGEILKRQLRYFNTAISCNSNGEVIVHGNAEIDGNLQVNGNQTETGNLNVDGYIKQSKFELDTDIPISFSSDYTRAGFSKEYAHARVSNGKLNIVLCIKCVHPAGAVYGILTSGSNSLTLPSEVLSKLYPIIGQSLATMAQSCGVAYDDQGSFLYNKQNIVIASIFKSSEGIYWSLINDEGIQDDDARNFSWRFEFNFLLS